MTLLRLGYLVHSLGNRAITLPTETYQLWHCVYISVDEMCKGSKNISLFTNQLRLSLSNSIMLDLALLTARC
jgi:hypothetical protein